MTELNELYKCNICGNIVEVINPESGELYCCGEPMELLVEQTSDDMYSEKHVPVVVIEGEKKIIRIGSVPHPMEKDHYITFIEAISPDKKYLKRKYLNPGDAPELDLKCCKCEEFTVRDYCNMHGLWSSKYPE